MRTVCLTWEGGGLTLGSSYPLFTRSSTFVSTRLYNSLYLVCRRFLSYPRHFYMRGWLWKWQSVSMLWLHVLCHLSFTVTVLVTMYFISSHVNLRVTFICGSLSPLQPPSLLPQHKFTQYFNYYVKTASKRDVQSSVFKILIWTQI
jgi:hypothetical protein